MEPVSLSGGRLRSPLLWLQSDERLARLASTGDNAAYEVVVRRHRDSLLRACGRILPPSQAEDAVQQALLSAHQALLRNGPPDRFQPWLHRIAVNAALKELRRAPKDLPLDEEGLDGFEQPAERVERHERTREALAAIAALPERQRRALVMRELEGRSHEEIAASLELTPGGARQLIHRARGALRSAVTALTPYGLLARMGTGEASSQATEIAAGGVAGAFAGKAAATVLIAGGIVGGVALAPGERDSKATDASKTPLGQIQPEVGEAATDSGPGDGEEDRSGPGGGENRDDDRSGSNRGDEDDDDRSGSRGSGSSGSGGSGDGGDVDGEDHSGSSSSGSGTSGPGTSGPGTSGSGSSGSGTSGPGSSGSGSSGSGEPELDDDLY